MKPLAPAMSTRTDNTSGKGLSTPAAKYGRLGHDFQAPVSSGPGIGRRRECPVYRRARAVRTDREPSRGGSHQWAESVGLWTLGGEGTPAQSAAHFDGFSGSSRHGHGVGLPARAGFWRA